MEQIDTLCVDCGGGGIKASVLDATGTLLAKPERKPVTYPLAPTDLVSAVKQLAASLPPTNRLTVGLPGMIRHGVVIHTPHYINRTGPGGRPVPALLKAWASFDLRRELQRALGLPTLVLNDAQLHGAGVIAGTGCELVLTLGTGLGAALFDGGLPAPHLELSRAPVRRGMIMDEYVGEQARLALGDPLWSRRVEHLLELLQPVYWWDRVYLGGGNSRMITRTVVTRLADNVVVVPNSAGLAGGARAWQLMG